MSLGTSQTLSARYGTVRANDVDKYTVDVELLVRSGITAGQ